jgi:catechol 2,3-dioxygenase-like lactoylglutathione lyase family enzyme
MQTSEKSTMTFRLELFVNNLPESLDFYRRVLGFEAGEQQRDGYTLVTNGKVQIGLNLLSNLREDHPIRPSADERLGKGVEIVLEVSDVEDVYARVKSQNWPISTELKHRPWGLTDFRVLDPNGYFLRLTSR